MKKQKTEMQTYICERIPVSKVKVKVKRITVRYSCGML